MKRQRFFIGILVALLSMTLTAGLSQAQAPPPEGEVQPEGEVGIAAVGAYIPVQGRLTDASGNPLNGTFNNVSLRIYETGSGGSILCQVTPPSLQVSNGLFSTYIPCSSGVIDGRQLYLAVKVGSDAEMTDRQPIYPVPYAFSLKPGANIIDNSSGTLLVVQNNGSGTGVYGYSLSGEGVHGWSEAGSGVHGYSTAGVSLMADGTGIIKSTAATDWNVSPLNIVPGDASGDGDLKIVHSTQFGWVALYSAGADDCTALLPLDVVAELFGTRVKFSEFHFCYIMADTDLDDQITQVDVKYIRPDGTSQILCSFTDDVSSTAWTCQTCIASSPVDIYGPLFARFTLHFVGDTSNDRIRLGHMFVRLVE